MALNTGFEFVAQTLESDVTANFKSVAIRFSIKIKYGFNDMNLQNKL